MDKIVKAALEALRVKQQENKIAAEEAKKKEDAQTVIETDYTRNKFREDFGIGASEVNGRIINIDGFLIHRKSKINALHSEWSIRKDCKNDDPAQYGYDGHEPIGKTFVYNLAEIGAFIETYENIDLCWRCERATQEIKTPVAPPTTEEKLLSALREFMAVNSYQGES